MLILLFILFQVIAQNRLKIGESSNVTKLEYDGDALIGALEGLTVTGHTNQSVSLKWDTVQGVEGYYITPRGANNYAALDTRLSADTNVEGM
jgi:hypothetical protein